MISLNKIWQKSTGQSRTDYIFFIALSLVDLILLFNVSKIGPIHFWDTYTYLTASGKLFDIVRTPVYPNLFFVFDQIFGKDYSQLGVVLFQILLFNFSVIYLLKLCRLFNFDKRTELFVFILYAFLPFVPVLTLYLATESFSVSLSVIFCYLLIKNLDQASIKSIVLIYVISLVMVLLRPSFLFLIIILMFMTIIYLAQKKLIYFSISTLFYILLILLVAAYSFKIREQTGVYTLSIVSVLNKGYIGVRNNLFDLEDGHPISDFIKGSKYINHDDLTRQITGKFGYKPSDEYFNKYIFNKIFIKNRLNEIVKISFTEKFLTLLYPLNQDRFWNILRYIGIPFFLFYGVLILVLRKVFLDWKQSKQNNLKLVFLLLFVLGVFGISILGADNHYGRLCAAGWPVFYLLGGLVLEPYLTHSGFLRKALKL